MSASKEITSWVRSLPGPTAVAYERSSRPHTMATKTSYEVEEKVLAARAEHREGPDVLGPKVEVPARPSRGSCAEIMCPTCGSATR